MIINRRKFLLSSALSLSFITNPKISFSNTKGRVILLGFDGVEPTIIHKMLEKGELQNIAKLKQQGGIYNLTSTIPPQSPTAWSSFATCKNPGQHGIYDFLRRDPTQYVPNIALGSVHHAEFDQQGNLKKEPYFENMRKGRTFWSIADEQGVQCKILNMPYSYPPDPLKNGVMLSGLGVPDIRGTESFFFVFSDKFTQEELNQSISGGMRLKLNFENSKAKVKLPAFRNPNKNKEFIEKVLYFTIDRTSKKITIEIEEQRQITIEQGNWSDWIEWKFPVTDTYSVHAISRFFIKEAGDTAFIYMTCLQYHPKYPYIPFTTPQTYSAELAKRYGLYKTIGWNYDTHALRQDVLTEDIFFEDVQKTMAWHEKLMLDELNTNDGWQLLMSMWMATDRVAHLYWRYRDPEHPMYDKEKAMIYGGILEETYKIMDRIVGNTLNSLNSDDFLIVMSDHGFTSYRKGFNLGTWLIREGYLVVEGQNDPSTAYNDQSFLQGYDWNKTKAYALGLGSIYLNLENRERNGVVKQTEAKKVRDEIKQKLLSVKDPQTGNPIISQVYTCEDFKGISIDNAPDLILGYYPGYQSTKASAKGSAPQQVFEDNKDKWSGDHVATDYRRIPGMLLTNKKPNTDKPHIQDIGVTILSYLNLSTPDDLEGKNILS
ncbi:MAG TPA: alkaline phosphatase family protein [Candidatus Hydrogenedens sp.]|nr:alkaline phosphatase family protein [Candidatus Hydrogenedens sp.]